MMSENDKFRLTLDNDGFPCIDIYGIISPSTKLTAGFNEYDKRYKVEDQLNNILKDIHLEVSFGTLLFFYFLRITLCCCIYLNKP